MSYFKKEAFLNLIVVLTPILIICIIITTQFLKKEKKAELLNVESDLIFIKDVLLEFKKQKGSFPESLSILTKEKGSRIWAGPFIHSNKLIDPWQSQYKILFMNNQPILVSFGPNKKIDTIKKDIEKKQNGGDDIVIFLQ